jgi:hypothetical protein
MLLLSPTLSSIKNMEERGHAKQHFFSFLIVGNSLSSMFFMEERVGERRTC